MSHTFPVLYMLTASKYIDYDVRYAKPIINRNPCQDCLTIASTTFLKLIWAAYKINGRSLVFKINSQDLRRKEDKDGAIRD